MKLSLGYVAIFPGLILAATLAHAAPEACHEPMQGQMGGQGEEMMFKRIDANGDGVISKEEFNAFQARHFQEMDANKDGKITLKEFQDGHSKMMGETRRTGTTHMDERFSAADTNHDGGLDREEAKAMPMLSMYFDEVDTNKDGKVTRQEYLDAMPLLHRAKKIDTGDKPESSL
jgi:Ca2+-binding EF-hand superfamily protein